MQIAENQTLYRFKIYNHIICKTDGLLYQLEHFSNKRTKAFRELKYNENRKAYYINGRLVSKKRLEKLKILPFNK